MGEARGLTAVLSGWLEEMSLVPGSGNGTVQQDGPTGRISLKKQLVIRHTHEIPTPDYSQTSLIRTCASPSISSFPCSNAGGSRVRRNEKKSKVKK